MTAKDANLNRERDEILRRYYGELTVTDAAHELRLIPNDDDCSNAKVDDPSGCVFAKACHRLYNSTFVLFFGHVAYVDLPDKCGKRRIERFHIPAETARAIRSFDETGELNPGGYILLPPMKSQRLDYRPPEDKVRHRALKGSAETKKADSASGPKATRQRKDMLVRDGRGMVQFLKK